MRRRIRAWWIFEVRPRIERVPVWIAWHLPRSVVYHSTIRVWVQATTGQHSGEHPDAIGMSTALKRWEGKE